MNLSKFYYIKKLIKKQTLRPEGVFWQGLVYEIRVLLFLPSVE